VAPEADPVTYPWISRLGGFFIVLFSATALALLQVSIAGTGLFFFLPSYGLVAIAALISFATLRSGSSPDLACLGASVIFGGYIVLRALTSPVSYVARADLYLVMAALTVYGLTAIVLSSSGKRIALIILLLTFAMLHVLLGLIEFGLGENFILIPFLQTLEINNRASGFYVNPDHFAGLLELLGIFGLSITCWSRCPSWSKVITGYLTAICYFGLVLTGSRGGYSSATASFLIFAVLSLIALRAGGAALLRRAGTAGLIALTLTLMVGTFFIHQSDSLSQRLANIAPDQTRLDLWRASIEQWKLQPLIGTGSGTYRFYGRQFRAQRMQNDPVDVHNDYLHLLCEYGLVGLLGFAIFFFTHLRVGWRSFTYLGPGRIVPGGSPLSNRLALNIGALSAIAAYVVHSIVDFNLHVPANALLLAFAFGVVANPGAKSGSEIPRPRENWVPRLCLASLGAILLFQSARLFPGEYYAERARTTLANEDPATAILLANKALIYEERNPNIFFSLGRAQAALGNQKRPSENRLFSDDAAPYYDAALTAFNKARRLAPLDETYPLDMAFVYDQLGRFAEAEWMFGIARSLDPRSINISQLYKTHLEAWASDRQQDSAKTP
jgi:O-antigen ligase